MKAADIAGLVPQQGAMCLLEGIERHDERTIVCRATSHRSADNPLRFHLADRGFRRANLKRFPYHMLYEIRPDALRVMLVRHNKRHPDYGLRRE